METNEIIDTLRILLLAGLALSGVLILAIWRSDNESSWYRRYLDEHPGLRSDFDVWRRRRVRELSLEAGRCPDHGVFLDTSGYCTRCHRRPDG